MSPSNHEKQPKPQIDSTVSGALGRLMAKGTWTYKQTDVGQQAGAPNRHSEAIKKQRLEESQRILSESPSSSKGQAVQALAALFSYPVLGAE
ncbi:hypothetical protein EJ05DRAFT_515645 [Pseudovirgaria hyperparasitica]|uniref:Uncharacterized protein n=1 Tax=Pseudovirgaria hyperparasitica TaxID=470096 RepID=A0A6A6VP75_9PEZI|nr:uncharacterized protein EJ05DRAFT_515645 [Pseudovirgaria hyperparasitica]KAF2752442.1 hypothetical protein EJ05DRAFT_515645 [Pseudovirgaria hyperparasitica]